MRGVTPGKGPRVAPCWIEGRLTKGPQAKAKMTPDHALPVGRPVNPASWVTIICSSESRVLQEGQGPVRPLQIAGIPQSSAPVGHGPAAAHGGCSLRAHRLAGWMLSWLLRGGWLGRLGEGCSSPPAWGCTLWVYNPPGRTQTAAKAFLSLCLKPSRSPTCEKRKETPFPGGHVAVPGAGALGPQRRVAASPSIQARMEAPRELPEEACCTPLGARMGVLRAHLPLLLGRAVGMMSKLNLCG